MEGEGLELSAPPLLFSLSASTIARRWRGMAAVAVVNTIELDCSISPGRGYSRVTAFRGWSSNPERSALMTNMRGRMEGDADEEEAEDETRGEVIDEGLTLTVEMDLAEDEFAIPDEDEDEEEAGEFVVTAGRLVLFINSAILLS